MAVYMMYHGPMSPPPFLFLFPDDEEKASGKVRINGVLVEPKGHKSDDDLLEAHKEAGNWDIDYFVQTGDEAVAKLVTVMDTLPKMLFHHQWLHEVDMMVFQQMERIPSIDYEIISRECVAMDDEPGYVLPPDKCEEHMRLVKRLKHLRQVFLDGSLIHAVDQAHKRMIQDITSIDLVHNPGAWEGYSVELIAYAIRHLLKSMAQLEVYREKRIDMGMCEEEIETTTGYMELLRGWNT
ncbi:unnamed protein product [Zymoseptoria tritici ST99CH_3D7]|uniref:Uncharacterized protein n=1 Tax=Zymoseptoria tritici (strain ST99CH_3D7) TaxID=1276538 RepID=A0A1X7RVP1_ZYMT9|nr:unnamed protein product [Zymoseptoria tritici ST99CH_3D7]